MSTYNENVISFIKVQGNCGELAYQGSYRSKLEDWKRKILSWSQQKIDVYCYFDNTNAEGHAVKDAGMLKMMLVQS